MERKGERVRTDVDGLGVGKVFDELAGGFALALRGGILGHYVGYHAVQVLRLHSATWTTPAQG